MKFLLHFSLSADHTSVVFLSDFSNCYRSYGRAPKMIHLESNFVQFKEELLPKEGNKALLTFPFLHIYWTECCVSIHWGMGMSWNVVNNPRSGFFFEAVTIFHMYFLVHPLFLVFSLRHSSARCMALLHLSALVQCVALMVITHCSLPSCVPSCVRHFSVPQWPLGIFNIYF